MNETTIFDVAPILIERALNHAKSLDVPITVAVCDAGGHLVALSRKSSAALASLESAKSKAVTSAYFRTETRNLPFDKAFTPALLAASSVPFAFIPGGVPVRDGNHMIGAVGIGGGTLEQDQQIAAFSTGT